MEELARLEARLESLKTLRDLFSAMQAMAASRVQAAQSALGGARKYAEQVEHSITDAVSLLPRQVRTPPAGNGPLATMLLIVCSEHGFTGAFNRLLLDRARIEARPGDKIAIVGRRGAALADEHGLSPEWTLPMATGVNGVLPTARRAAAQLREAEDVRVVFGRYRGGTRFEIEVRQVLPPDPQLLAPQQAHAGPLYQLDPTILLRRLIGELLLAELVLAMIESFASENSARLQIMQAADHNIYEKLEGLTRKTRQLRQDSITSEMLEVVAGGEAVAGYRSP
jgi:F-type H+-transporting ATPase subunit gamma